MEYSISKALVKWVFAADQESIYGTRKCKNRRSGNVIAIFLGAAAAGADQAWLLLKGLRRPEGKKDGENRSGNWTKQSEKYRHLKLE